MHFPELDSTNAYALKLLSKSNPAEGTVISTDFQQLGRGQLGSSWHAQARQNIMLSLILYPDFLLPKQQFRLNQAVALGVYDFVETLLSEPVRIKWPNDIYVGDQKLGGILIQNSILPTAINSSVVGIGINVNQVDFPPSLPNPCSLATLTRKDKNVRKLTARLCQHLERRYLQLKAGKHRQMQEEYLLCLYKFMEETLFQTADGRLISGRITGVTESGKLSIHHTNGAEHFGLKEIQLIQRS